MEFLVIDINSVICLSVFIVQGEMLFFCVAQ
jgi:hypothetical protein